MTYTICCIYRVAPPDKKVVRKLLAGFTCDGKGTPKRAYSVALQSVAAAAELNCALM